MTARRSYRLYHRPTGKYVAWPHGRQHIPSCDAEFSINDLMGMLRIENHAWGGTDDAPVLEVHSVDRATGTVWLVKHLPTWDAALTIQNRKRRAVLRRQRSDISATATPGGTEASQTIRRSTT